MLRRVGVGEAGEGQAEEGQAEEGDEQEDGRKSHKPTGNKRRR